jgi:MFS family permease
MLTGAALLALVWRAPGVMWPIYVIYMVGSSARSFFNPAAQAIIPSLVPRDQLSGAIAFSAGGVQAAQILGPALGGIFYAVDPRLPFFVAALLYAMAALSGFVIQPQTTQTEHRMPMTLVSLLAGFQYAWQQKVVLGAVSLDMFVVMFGGVVALLPIYAHDILHTGPWGLGLLRASPAVGAVAMAAWLAHSGFVKRNAGARLFGAIAVYGAATALFGISNSLVLSMSCLAVVGASDMISVVIRHTMVQGETPDHLRGRVAGVNTLFISSAAELGQLRAGVMAWLMSATAAVIVGGLASILLAVLWPQLFPGLRQRDHLVEDRPEAARA